MSSPPRIRVVTYDFGEFEYDGCYWSIKDNGSVAITKNGNSIAHFAKGSWAYVEDIDD